MQTVRRSIFRPCIDLHDGQVKQIVGGTLSESSPETLRTNFVATQSAGDFARLYRDNKLDGAHVIKLGPRNDAAAREALQAWPCGLQIGGGISDQNAQEWIDAGASKVWTGISSSDANNVSWATLGDCNVVPLPERQILAGTIAENICGRGEGQACCRCQVRLSLTYPESVDTARNPPAAAEEGTNGS
ncbi:hypothetical protein DXG03_002857 [Asterophora parasitica]|uniref:Phosphoribosylformimino-5-aminoimidazole carboxamide ribotide isomerase n=1 Tax=Asterophora parasitica TaxID=117018 RepID=A0A9P7G9U1_9AGAR|nr:hypothetical protein DXG03_002857 [Asterophora parasitica]